MCLEEAPSTQRTACQLCKALLHVINGSEVESSLPHSYASKCAGRETKARYYMPYEQPLGDGSPAEGLPSLASSKEAPSLPTKAPSYEAKRPAPKAQDRCASKRHPSMQRSVCQLCKARLRIVISSEARNLCHSRPSGQCLEIPNVKPAIHLPSGIVPYILQRSCHHNP